VHSLLKRKNPAKKKKGLFEVGEIQGQDKDARTKQQGKEAEKKKNGQTEF